MDNKFDELVKQVKKQLGNDYRLLNDDDTFRFSCNSCGSCCKNRKDITLTPFDIYRTSKFLNMNPNDFIKKYGDLYIGENSYLPLIAMKFKNIDYGNVKYTVCPFNRKKEGKGLCSIHPAKPFVCLSYPVGRISIKQSENENRYIVSNDHCGSDDENAKEYTIKTWFKEFDLEKNEVVAKEYNSMICDIATIVDLNKLNHEKGISREVKSIFYNQLYSMIYFDIDLDKDIVDVIKEKNIAVKEKVIEFIHILHKTGINIKAKGYKLDENVLKRLD